MALVVGPTEPATNRGLPAVLNSSAACRANSAARLFRKCASAASPYSASTMGAPPKLFVSTMSDPASKYFLWISRTTSGRVRTRFSLQPSSAAPPKSAALRFRCCSMVPIAPSSTRILCPSNSRRAFADSLRLRIRRNLPLLAVSPHKTLQISKESSVSGHLYFTQASLGYLSPSIELVFFAPQRCIIRIEQPAAPGTAQSLAASYRPSENDP